MIKKALFSLEKTKFEGLGGEPLNIDRAELGRTLGNYIYTTQADLGWLETAQALYKGTTVEMPEERAEQLIAMINAPECGLILPVKIGLVEGLKASIQEPETRISRVKTKKIREQTVENDMPMDDCEIAECTDSERCNPGF